MSKTLRHFLFFIAFATFIATLASPSLAQCPSAREFGMWGGGMLANKIRIDMTEAGTQNVSGLEIGYFWENGIPANTNVNCPSTPEWWIDVTPGAERSIRGFVASPTCIMAICPSPGAVMNFVVEDESADGQDAGFIMFQVDETPPQARWWDLERTANAPPFSGTTTIVPFRNFPKVEVVGSVETPGNGPCTTVTNDYSDVIVNYHGAQGPVNAPTPASTGIAAYDVMIFLGASDPGRERSAWTLLKKIPYGDASILNDIIDIPCDPDPAIEAFLAIGIEFVDGVASALVGRSTLIGKSFLAEPEPKLRRVDPGRRNRSLGRSGR